MGFSNTWYRFIAAPYVFSNLTFVTIVTFSIDFPQIMNLTVKKRNVSITWLPVFEEECHVFWFLVYYREVISKVNRGQWNIVNVSQHNTTSYDLQLQCHKKYEITVTASTANGETPLNQSKLWNVATRGGNYSQTRLSLQSILSSLILAILKSVPCLCALNNNSHWMLFKMTGPIFSIQLILNIST